MDQARPLALWGGHVWDGLADAATPGDLFVDGNTIVAHAVPGALELDIAGCTVIPGLIEGHAHLCFNGAANWRATYDGDTPASMLVRMAGHAQRMARAGITTVRDLGAPTDLAVELRDAIAGGLLEGPSLLVAGAPITTTGGHCYFMGGEADGIDGVRIAVRQRARAGVDWIKIMATGGNMTPRTNTFAPQYTVGELRACVEDAHRLGRRVAAHAHGTAGIRQAVEARVDVIEHCSFSTPLGIERDDALIEAIAAAGIIVSPTVSIGYRRWTDDGRKAARADVMRAMVATGCRLVMSTDCGIPNVPHEALAQGMLVMQELSGLPAIEVLKLATSRSAELLDLNDRGVIQAGKRADLLIVDGDPTVDLAALTKVKAVFVGGVPFGPFDPTSART